MTTIAARRRIGELFVIHYNDPSSHRKDWGGPSPAGVLAVHTGPAVAIIATAVVRLRRRRDSRHPTMTAMTTARLRFGVALTLASVSLRRRDV